MLQTRDSASCTDVWLVSVPLEVDSSLIWKTVQDRVAHAHELFFAVKAALHTLSCGQEQCSQAHLAALGCEMQDIAACA